MSYMRIVDKLESKSSIFNKIFLYKLIIYIFFTSQLISGCNGGDETNKPTDHNHLKIWYRDADGDGYGTDQEFIKALSQPPGYVANKDDCNDDEFLINPESYEICADGIDQDCDGEDLNYNGIAHATGEMAGEITKNSVILQSRLTNGCKPPRLDRPGGYGFGRFEISTSRDFKDSFLTEWVEAEPENDFIIKKKVSDLSSGTRYYFRLQFGKDTEDYRSGPICTFETLGDRESTGDDTFVVITGMNYFTFHFLEPETPNRQLGYPALETIMKMNPDFIVGTGDNVYYDAFPIPARTQAQLRAVWHMQFLQPRFILLLSRIPVYWEKDDHDFRFNDADLTTNIQPLPELGIKTFLEQLPVVDPQVTNPVTYRTYRINKHLQLWFTEGRDYRSPNMMEDGPQKTMWGETQKRWLKETLLKSDATFKILVSPTPMIGPDDLYVPWPAPTQDDFYRRDNHTNPKGFRYEGEEFFAWLKENGFLEKNFFIICGDRHWQYHSIRQDGFEEFSCGALVDSNSRLGRSPGDPLSTDPDGTIIQPYLQPEASGGFLRVTVRDGKNISRPSCEFTFFDEYGQQFYSVTRYAY